MKVLVSSQIETIIIMTKISHDNLFSLQASCHVWLLPYSPFSRESCLNDTIVSSLWKKLLELLYIWCNPSKRVWFLSCFGLKSSIDACGMGIGQVHYNVRDIYI